MTDAVWKEQNSFYLPLRLGAVQPNALCLLVIAFTLLTKPGARSSNYRRILSGVGQSGTNADGASDGILNREGRHDRRI